MKSVFCWLAILTALLFSASPAQNSKQLARIDTVFASQLIPMIQKDTGYVVMLSIWATWCDACKDEMPGIVQVEKKYSSQKFKLYLLSADDLDEKKVAPTLRKLGVDFHSYIKSDTTDEDFIKTIHPGWSGALPTTFFYDKRGNLNEMIVGARTFGQYDGRVKKLLAQ
jgi:thiol-disulfide isomerase/thioredoxin